MKIIIKRLRIDFFAILVLALIQIMAYEYELLPQGMWADDERMQYFLNVAGIMLAFILLPMSMKLLSFKTVRSRVSAASPSGSKSYMLWSEIRMAMLAASLWINLFFHYQTLTSSGLGCAVMSFFALMFCWPSVEKMNHETCKNDTDDETKVR